MPEPITIAAIGVGTWFAQWASGKGFGFLWRKFKNTRIVDRAIEETSDHFETAYNRPSDDLVSTCLKNWTEDPGFERLFRRLSKREKIEEDYIVDHFIEKGGIPKINI